MGNTESSAGLMAGSVLGGLLLAPFTGGTSLALVAAASGTGTAIGWTATTVNMLNDRRAPEGERMKHFLIGTGCGAIGPLTAGAAGLGAEVSLSVGVDVAGSAIALGCTNAGDGNMKPYVGNPQLAVEHYRNKAEKETFEREQRLESKSIRLPEIQITHQYIGDYPTLYAKISKIPNKGSYEYLRGNNGYKKNLKRFGYDMIAKTTFVSCALVNFDKVILKIYQLQDLQRTEFNTSFHHFTKAFVYAVNAIDTAKNFESETSSHMYGMYAQQMDESFKNYCILMKSAMGSFVDGIKKVYTSGRHQALIERKVDCLYDEVAKSKAKDKPMCKKYGIYMDSEKYKLNLEQKIQKIEEHLNKDSRINTFEGHFEIYKMIDELKKMVQ
jgi:hypothetical protein